jgi:hypothetical protein
MWKAFLWMVQLYIPPPPGDAVRLWRFQATQSIGLVGLWLVVWATGAWVIGLAPSWVPRFAWADEVADAEHKADAVNRSLGAIQLLGVKSNIGDQLKASCLAFRSGNQADLDSANNQLITLRETYFQMTGHEYHLPACDTILVESKP